MSPMNYTRKLATAMMVGAILTVTSSVHAQTPVLPDTILASNSRVSVTYEDLVAELARIPEENRLEFMLSAQRLATVVENILLSKIMSAEAQKSGLQNQPNVAAEIRNLPPKRQCSEAIVAQNERVGISRCGIEI